MSFLSKKILITLSLFMTVCAMASSKSDTKTDETKKAMIKVAGVGDTLKDFNTAYGKSVEMESDMGGTLSWFTEDMMILGRFKGNKCIVVKYYKLKKGHNKKIQAIFEAEKEAGLMFNMKEINAFLKANKNREMYINKADKVIGFKE